MFARAFNFSLFLFFALSTLIVIGLAVTKGALYAFIAAGLVVGGWIAIGAGLRERVMRVALVAVPYLWLLALFLVPFLIVVKISLSDTALAIPPYTPELDLREGWAGVKEFLAGLDFENFEFLASDDLYWRAYLSSLQIAAISGRV